MKWLVAVLLAGYGVLGFLFFKSTTPPVKEYDWNWGSIANIGLEAGINATLVNGTPRSHAELDQVRIHARKLIEAVVPEIEWHWPALKTNGIKGDDA